MRHALQVERFGIRLRPVRMADAPFIVWLRNLDYVKGNVGDSAADVAGQEAWLKKYFEREGDYYFIVETLGEYLWALMAFMTFEESARRRGGMSSVRK